MNFKMAIIIVQLTAAHLHEVLIEFRVHESYVCRDVFVQYHGEDRSHGVDSGIAEQQGRTKQTK